MKISFFVALALSAHSAWGQSRKLRFESAVDRFELRIQGNAGTVQGKTADLFSLKDTLPAFDKTLTGPCPKLAGKPDVVVTEEKSEKAVYVSAGVVSDGKNCMTISGEGWFYFPIHRDFLIGPVREGISLANSLKVVKKGKKLIHLKKQGGEWVNLDAQNLLNWNFLSHFENSLSDYQVRTRLQLGISKGKPKIMVQTGTKRFEFYKITPIMWAVRKPGSPYLVASDNWSFWGNLEKDLIEDSYAPQIRKLWKSDLSKNEKTQLLDELQGIWSPNLRELYHHLLVKDPDDAIQELALRRLRQKPSLTSVPFVMTFIEKTNREDLKREAVGILKIQNPQGPKYDPSVSVNERNQVIDFWRDWCKKIQNQK